MKMKKKLLVMLGAVALLAAGAAGGYQYYMNYTKSQEAAAEAQKADPEETEAFYTQLKELMVAEEEDPYENTINFAELEAINPDVYAWITVPETNVNYPILRSMEKPDEYYLNTTMEGKTGLPGSIYVEKYNSADFSDTVTIVYGHNMEDDSMFGDLHKYGDRAFFDANPYIYIYQPGVRLKYQVFAAVAFDDRYIIGSYNFGVQEDFAQYITDLKSSFEGNVNDEVPINNRIVTLSTCIGGYPEQRWLVNAVLVEEERE